jgi:hypothetical protein
MELAKATEREKETENVIVIEDMRAKIVKNVLRTSMKPSETRPIFCVHHVMWPARDNAPDRAPEIVSIARLVGSIGRRRDALTLTNAWRRRHVANKINFVLIMKGHMRVWIVTNHATDVMETDQICVKNVRQVMSYAMECARVSKYLKNILFIHIDSLHSFANLSILFCVCVLFFICPATSHLNFLENFFKMNLRLTLVLLF